MTNEFIPISDEQAKAIQEALKTLQGLGSFVKETFGTAPQDLVALLGGDYLKVKRAENLAKIIEKAKERIGRQRTDGADRTAPLSLGLPMMVSAAEESRDELQDLWAALMAAVVDPDRSGFFRLKFIEIAKRMDPLDAPVLKRLGQYSHPVDHQHRTAIMSALGVTLDQVLVSISNLEELGLVATGTSYTNTVLPLGREFLRAIDNGAG
jgi:hypothetical protein